MQPDAALRERRLQYVIGEDVPGKRGRQFEVIKFAAFERQEARLGLLENADFDVANERQIRFAKSFAIAASSGAVAELSPGYVSTR